MGAFLSLFKGPANDLTATERIDEHRNKRDSGIVRKMLYEAERGLAVSTPEDEIGTVHLAAIDEAAAINILDPNGRVAVLHAIYALCQIVDEEGTMPELLIPLFEAAACELLSADSATLYEFDDLREELHSEARSENASESECVSTVIELGEGEIGDVAERALRGDRNVASYWSPSPGSQAIAVPMRTQGGRGRLVGVAVAFRRDRMISQAESQWSGPSALTRSSTGVAEGATMPVPPISAMGSRTGSGVGSQTGSPGSASGTQGPVRLELRRGSRQLHSARAAAVGQSERTARAFSVHDEVRLRALADGSAGLVLQTMNHREAVTLRYQAELLLALHSADPTSSGLDEAILKMIVIMIQMLSAEKVSLFIADDLRREFWIRTSELSAMGGVEGVSFPFGFGIVGRVYESKKSLNLPDAYMVNYFSPKFDQETGYVTRQVLAVPLLDDTGRVIAIVQALNKHNGTDVFTTADERVLSSCAEKIALTLREKLGRATFRELLHDKRAGTQAFQIMSGAAGAEATQPVDADGDEPLGLRRIESMALFMSDISDLPQLSLSIETWNMGKDDLTLRVMLMLTEMNLCSVLNIPNEALLLFLRDVQSEYLDAAPYHNYQHAFTVTLICFHLLKDLTKREVLRPLDMLALLLSAICHDVAHPGVNNAFLVNSNADLALVYNDQSVLEHHHAATMFRLLHKLGKRSGGKYDILGRLSVRDRAEFRKTCISMILATDMTKHFSQVDTLHSIAAKMHTRREALELSAVSRLEALTASAGPLRQSPRAPRREALGISGGARTSSRLSPEVFAPSSPSMNSCTSHAMAEDDTKALIEVKAQVTISVTINATFFFNFFLVLFLYLLCSLARHQRFAQKCRHFFVLLYYLY